LEDVGMITHEVGYACQANDRFAPILSLWRQRAEH
jgi:hypothetical protein